MNSLLEKKCTACELGAPIVPDEDQITLLKDLDGWLIDKSEIPKLIKVFKFTIHYVVILPSFWNHNKHGFCY